MNKYKLLALDIDGTVLNDQQVLTEETKKWINIASQAGIIVCFATGRTIDEVAPITTALQLETPIVTVNGSEVWKSPREVMTRQFVEPQWIELFVNEMLEQQVKFWVISVEGKYNGTTWNREALSDRWLKFGMHTDQEEIRHATYQMVKEWGTMEISNSHPHNLEFNPLGVNKATGLLKVCHLLSVDMSEIVAVGDSINDLAMIQSAGLGVAMGNAQDIVKSNADLVTTTNNEDGVAQIIKDVIVKGS